VVGIEGDRRAGLRRLVQQGREHGPAVVADDRQGYAGEVDQLRLAERFAQPREVGQPQVVADRRLAAPVGERPFARRVALDRVEAGQPALDLGDEVDVDPLGPHHREHAAAEAVAAAERGGVGDAAAEAGEVDGGVGVSPA
jgi:hypothetical protein